MFNTIILPLFGGILIGLSSTLMLKGLGRITGISGILALCLNPSDEGHLGRLGFLAGLLGAGIFFFTLYPTPFFDYQLEAPPLKIAIAGLLVGFGTRLGSGCTSGHGVCGLGRLQGRSLVATLTFMAFGILTVWLERFLT